MVAPRPTASGMLALYTQSVHEVERSLHCLVSCRLIAVRSILSCLKALRVLALALRLGRDGAPA